MTDLLFPARERCQLEKFREFRALLIFVVPAIFPALDIIAAAAAALILLLLQAFMSHFYNDMAASVLRADYTLYLILAYLTIFRLEELTFTEYRKFVESQVREAALERGALSTRL